MQVDPVAEERGEKQSGGVDERAANRAEDRAVHDCERIGHGEWGGGDDCKDRDGEGIGKRANYPNLVLDSRLMANNQERQHERGGQQSESCAPPEEAIQAMIERAVITVLCGVGLYTALFMLRKTRRAARGELLEPRVVETPPAHRVGVPKAALGSLYYPAVAIAVWFVNSSLAAIVLLAVVFGAAAASVALGYSLLFITRRPCPYCWTSHVVNWTLFVLSCRLFVPHLLSQGI